MNILISQSKTDALSEVIRLNTHGNVPKTDNLGGPSFIDTLFSGQSKMDNVNVFKKGSMYFESQDTSTSEGPKENDNHDLLGLQSEPLNQKEVNNDKSDTKEIEYLDVTDNNDTGLEKNTIEENNHLDSYQETSKEDTKIVSASENMSKEDTKIVSSPKKISKENLNKKDLNIKSEIIANLKELLAKDEIKIKEPELFSMLKKILGLVRRVKGDDSKSGVAKILQGTLSSEKIKGKDIKTGAIKGVNLVKELKAIKDLVELISDVKKNPQNQELMEKVGTILSSIDGKDANLANSDIIAKVRKIILQEGTQYENKGRSVMVEKNIMELKNNVKGIKETKRTESENDITLDSKKAFLKNMVENIKEFKDEHINTKENITENRQNLFEKVSLDKAASKDQQNVKVSGKKKDSADRISRDKDAGYNDDGNTVERRVSKDRNGVESSSSDRDIRVEQKGSFTQSVKDSLTGDNHSKNKFAQHNNKGKSDNSKQLHVDSDNSIANNKAQNILKSGTNDQVSKTSTYTRTISQSQLGEMVVRGARQFQKGGNSEIHLTIRKPNLGNIKVSFVENSKGKLEVLIVAERHDATELIKQNSAEIKQLLMQEGMDLSKFDVFDSQNNSKRYFTHGNGSRRKENNNAANNDDGLADSNETMAWNDSTGMQGVEGVNNQQVNVIA